MADSIQTVDSSPTTPEAMEVVRVEDVSKIYGRGPNLVRALSNVTLSIRRGEFVVLSGPSGSGKSTLLNLIGALDVPTSGSIAIGGQKLSDLRSRDLARMRRERIGFIFQSYNLIPILTVVENTEFTLALQHWRRRKRRQQALAALAQVGLADKAHRLPSELSGGQQQRVAIARALAAQPAIILADEPTASLDSVTADGVLDLIQNLNARFHVTFIVSTHDPRVMSRAQRIVPMGDGRLLPST